ncbi:MAG: cytidine deaminase [Pygmaiobacter sp.]|nr:cytidine deaminase [Pygmaiobacter sp.]
MQPPNATFTALKKEGDKMMDEKELIWQALAAREKAYTPYSHFKVGAALLAKNGKVYTGCNIENAAYTPTSCAERTALVKAVSEGERGFSAIAIVGSMEGKTNTLVTGPCGVCRQALAEFCAPDFIILLAKSPEDYVKTTLGELLPYGFGPANLELD